MPQPHTPPPYFPFSVQIGNVPWRELELEEVARSVRDGRFPPIMFFRQLADRLGRRQGRSGPPVLAGQLNLYALLGRVYRQVINRYLADQEPGLLAVCLARAGFGLPSPALRGVLEAFGGQFPPGELLFGGVASPATYFAADDPGGQRKEHAAVELLLLRLAAENRALDPFRELLDDRELAAGSAYPTCVAGLERELAAAPPVAPLGFTLPELLRLPLKVAPGSLYDQLEYIRTHWRTLLPADLLAEIGVAFTVVHEEARIFAPRGEPGGAPVLEFGRGRGGAGVDDFYPEYERFSTDTDWMPNVVLIAKMVYVWLDQLAKFYGREIVRLDQVPDEELDRLARWGFTGLWLIGLWERSPASQTIKHLTGNREAIASAYSLFDYQVATDLGGWDALHDLKERALRRGIRLASDMVPNHTGIYSRWIVEHPHWFVQLDYPPYPSYRYTGPDLSSAPEVSIHIEDGYWDRTDAAVVFKLYDHRDGRERYLYHGNDGTSTPWNDTAQLNYLLPEVREAAIQTILHVARNFPIIRFDAAMTLAKRHYQRLWFPQPGHAGVPSRAEHGLTREEFDRAVPEEFWRQVVDRVAAEVPETLLLAEAFWLMEGYFVRTLGMHRVYNSAFMNMLKMEENAKYRQTLKNVLEFDPRVLQRFVNFMNNPDERTAVEQFGKEEKYFGACMLLATMPGLPMFGHGQVEGFHEKYGMEYRRAYWDEPVDEHLVREHERWIFPLLRRRWLFSGADSFVLYDFWAGDHVSEDVFAYSNRSGDQRGLILYHNRYAATGGWIKESAAFAALDAAGGSSLRRTTLGAALAFQGDGRHYYAFRDYVAGTEYLRNGRELCEQGLFVELGAYECHAFLDFREIWDDEFGTWGRLCHQLAGQPVPSLEEEVKTVRYASVHDCLRALLDLQEQLLAAEALVLPAAETLAARSLFERSLRDFLAALAEHAGECQQLAGLVKKVGQALAFLAQRAAAGEGGVTAALAGTTDRLLLLAWLACHRLGELTPGGADPAARSAELVHRFALARPLEEELAAESGEADDPLAQLDPASVADLFRALVRWQGFLALPLQQREVTLPALLTDPAVGRFLLLHDSGGFAWFNRERWELLVPWLGQVALLAAAGESRTGTVAAARRKSIEQAAATLVQRAAAGGYRVDRLPGPAAAKR